MAKIRSERLFLAAFVCCIASHVALAEDYPYTGAYAIAANDAETERWRGVACLTHFFTQTSSGKYALFHLDPRALMQKNRLRYVVYETGKCTHAAKDAIDSCQADYSYRGSLDPYFVRYENREFGNTRVVIGESRAALSPLNTQRFGSTALVQVKCPIPFEVLRLHMSLKRTTYPQADVRILTGLFGLAPLLEFHKRVRAILEKRSPQQNED